MCSLLPPPPSGGPRKQAYLETCVHRGKGHGLAGLATVCRVLGVVPLHSPSLTGLLTSYSERAAFPEWATLSHTTGRGERKRKELPLVPGSALGTLHHNLVISPFIQMRRKRLRQAATQVCLVPRFQTYQDTGKKEVAEQQIKLE